MPVDGSQTQKLSNRVDAIGYHVRRLKCHEIVQKELKVVTRSIVHELAGMMVGNRSDFGRAANKCVNVIH